MIFVKKYGKYQLKALKSMLIDFYEVDAVCCAKKQLLSDVETLISTGSLSTKPPSLPTKRTGDDRLIKDIDDIFALITFLDECKMLSSLPLYVSDDPDGMPSSRLYEGDLQSLVAYLSKLDQKVAMFGNNFDCFLRHGV